jgi:hypothetical protein
MRGLREGLPGIQTEPTAKRQARHWLAQVADPEAEPRKPRKESRIEMSEFDDQVKQTEVPENFTHQEVYDFVKAVYDFCIPENKEPGEHAFGLLDYYNMEYIGAWLKKNEAELSALRAAVDAARDALKECKGLAKTLYANTISDNARDALSIMEISGSALATLAKLDGTK